MGGTHDARHKSHFRRIAYQRKDSKRGSARTLSDASVGTRRHRRCLLRCARKLDRATAAGVLHRGREHGSEQPIRPHCRVPLSYFGLVFYSYMFALCALLAFDPWSRGLRVGALLYTALGVALSIYFMYLQVNFIRAICIYCAFSALTTLALFLAALWHFRSTRQVASP